MVLVRENFSLVVAMDRNGVIGKEGKMPWNIPEDLRYFRELTMGDVIVMGRETHESIGKALEGRLNVVLTRDENWGAKDCVVVHSIDEVLEKFQEERVYIIGGAQIYRKFLPYAYEMYITFVDKELSGDTFFPKINWENWDLIYRKEGKESREEFRYFFTKYERRK